VGYVVFSPEFRSSGLLGRSSVEKYLRRQDMFARDQDDVVSGVDHLVRLGLADPNRVAVTGHSWGAYVVNWLITHSDRFQVAVSFEGESDYTLAYGTDSSLGGNTYWEGLFQGKPWETPGNYLKNSPAHSIRRVKIPTLFVSGAKGAALFHNQYLHTVLRQHGVDTQRTRECRAALRPCAHGQDHRGPAGHDVPAGEHPVLAGLELVRVGDDVAVLRSWPGPGSWIAPGDCRGCQWR
jgi:hypothetical protein